MLRLGNTILDGASWARALRRTDHARRCRARLELLWRLLQEQADALTFERDGAQHSGPTSCPVTRARFVAAPAAGKTPVLERSGRGLWQLLCAWQPCAAAPRTQARRQLLWRLLQHQAESITFARDGLRWSGPIDSLVTADLFVTGQYQHACMPALFRWLAHQQPRWHASRRLVNVGAFIGDTCIALARHTGKAVLACEPVPPLFAFLQQNVTANCLDHQIQCHALAIARTAGWTRVLSPRQPEYSEVCSGTGQQGFPHAPGDCAVFQVRTAGLDEWLAGQGVRPTDVGLVWSDTQGLESEVLESGVELWRGGVPLWVEVWPIGLEAHGGVTRFLQNVRRHFRGFLTATDFQKHPTRAPRAIASLEPMARSLPDRAFMDVLLVP